MDALNLRNEFRPFLSVKLVNHEKIKNLFPAS
jgi:hypothetical protein